MGEKMKELKQSKLNVIKNVSILTLVFGGLSFYSFNCAPPSFQVADQNSLVLSSTDGVIAEDFGPLLDEKVTAPQALLTSEQVYESMMNLTGQKATVTNAQLGEFDRRSGAFGVSPELNKVNAPMMIALTSFSGEVCNGLVQREQNLAAAQRQYFQNVNFGMAIAQLNDTNYQDVVSKLTNSFMGRAPSSEEVTLFSTYRTEFIAAIPAANVAQTAQTRALVLSTCAAVLSGFDLYTY